ncbi:MAG: hypothetical protein JXB46_06590 [Candidatus Eisenbacteria bacterium]|nr:hypothetical protein [Candidatus Eisenbacteria bacterium]
MRRPLITTGLLALAAVNVAWAVAMSRPTPLIGAIVYSAVAFQVVRHAEYRAAFFVGIAGAALHLFEFLRGGAAAPGGHAWFVAANIVIPAAVSVLALVAWRRSAAEKRDAESP